MNKNQENSINNKKRKINHNISLKTFKRSNEGYALNWAPLLPGVLAAGGCDAKLEIYFPNESTWVKEDPSNNFSNICKGHSMSVEDVVWSPTQPFVLSTCSVDKSIKFWDLRMNKKSEPITIQNAHESDVNCVDWNKFCDFMIASGGDDCAFKVWDIRYINNGPISDIKWHKAPISALTWDPHEDSQLAVCSEDNRLSIWDFSVEPDDNRNVIFDNLNNKIPEQLVFLHQGQYNLKDVRFHPFYKNFVMSTAENGINIFKPAFDDESDAGDYDDEYMKID